MSSRIVMSVLVAALLFLGCAGPTPKPKPTASEPGIREEDVIPDKPRGAERDDPGSRSDAENRAETSQPTSDSSATVSSEQPPAGEGEPRKPRRFIWRDRKGSGKSWESDTKTEREQ